MNGGEIDAASLISVVMGVYNGAPALPATIDSILSQRGVDLEFVIVDDGSTDATPAVLARYAAADQRLRIIRQQHAGLTQALIRGCAAARGEFIARQDAGDTSLPQRLHNQLHTLRAHPGAVLVSCGTRFVDGEGEVLYEIIQDQNQAQAGLRALTLQAIQGPSHHGATLFARDAYTAVGGYRACFAVAQDLDLWLRLAERGTHLALPEVLYEAQLTPHAISSRRRRQQIATARLILECARLRRAGLDEQAALARVGDIERRAAVPFECIGEARHYYFLGRCLQTRNPAKARRYYRRALGKFPLHLKAWWRWLRAAV